MTPAIEKMERRLAALDKQIDTALADPANLPADWERLVTNAGDLVDRIAAASREYRSRPVRRS